MPQTRVAACVSCGGHTHTCHPEVREHTHACYVGFVSGDILLRHTYVHDVLRSIRARFCVHFGITELNLSVSTGGARKNQAIFPSVPVCLPTLLGDNYYSASAPFFAHQAHNTPTTTHTRGQTRSQRHRQQGTSKKGISSGCTRTILSRKKSEHPHTLSVNCGGRVASSPGYMRLLFF